MLWTVLLLLLVSIKILSSAELPSYLPSYATGIENVDKLILKCGNLSLIPPFALKKNASAKIPSGLYSGNFIDLGDFDQCYHTKAQTEIGPVFGKYCISSMKLDLTKFNWMALEKNMRVPLGLVMPFRMGVCIPSWCTAEQISGDLIFTEELCTSQATPLEPTMATRITLAILLFFLFITATSTIYEIILRCSDQKTPHELLVAFSLVNNGKKLFTTTDPSDSNKLLCLDGIKAISTLWIVMGHLFSFSGFTAAKNFFDVVLWVDKIQHAFIYESTIIVDSFLVLAGLLTVLTTLKSLDRGVKFNIALYYLNRILRFWPLLIIVILIHANLVDYVSNGPLWVGMKYFLVNGCVHDWWKTLFFINNQVENGQCIPQTWYLAVDMQLFFLTPFLLIPLWKWPERALVVMLLLVIAGVIIPFSVAYKHGLLAFADVSLEHEKYYYNQTYSRFGPYVVGMILGYVIYVIQKSKRTFQLHPIFVGVSWMAILSIFVYCFIAGFDLMRPEVNESLANAIYMGTNRTLWAINLSLLIFFCCIGYGGPINQFLSLPIFQILSKLSYAIFLLHFVSICIRIFTKREVFYFSTICVIYDLAGLLAFLIPVAAVFCLLIEMPFANLQKYFMKRLLGEGCSKKIN